MNTTYPTNTTVTGMTAVTLKGLWANKSRFWLSSIAVIMSVAFLTAMLILTSAMAGTATEDVAAANAGVDAVVFGQELGLGDGPPGAEAVIRAGVPPSTVDALLAIEGVDDAVGIKTTTAQLLDTDGTIVDLGALMPVGQSWVANETLSNFALVEGTAPVDGVVIDQNLASSAGLEIGDATRVLTAQGIAEVNVDGIVTFGGATNAPDAGTILFAVDDPLLGTAEFERIVVDTDLEISALEGALSVGTIETGDAYVADLQESIDAGTSFLRIFFLAFASIAFVAGTTIIYNTFVIAVAQRTRELALLRSIGASRKQVLNAIMGESAVIGVIASAVGALAGIGAAYGMVALFEAIGFSLITGSLTITSDSLIIAAGAGLVVTLISAFMPARKAANTPPIAALRDAAVDPSAVSKVRNSIAAVLLVGGIVAAAIGGTWEIAVGGVLAAFVGVIVGGPLLAESTARLAGAPLEKAGGAVGRLASTNAARNPRRSASTALALTLGVALIAFFTVIASSLAGTAASDTEAALSADIVVTPFEAFGGPGSINSLSPAIAESVELTDGVEAVVAVSSSQVFADEAMAVAAGVDIDKFQQAYSLEVTQGSLQDVSGTAIAVQADAANGVAIGDELNLVFGQTGETTVTVAAIFDNSLPGQFGAAYIFDDAALATVAPDASDTMVLISTDGSTAASLAVAASVEEISGAVVQSAEEYIASIGSEVDSFLNFIYALVGAAVLIAIVGIANTTVMAVGERTKEIGMLRSVGMTASQIRRMIRNEALLLSVQGSLLGLAIGVGAVYATFAAVGDDNAALTLPVTSLAIIGVAAAISGVAAAAWPAWKASRMAPLEAMA